jgi:hypothetical protein
VLFEVLFACGGCGGGFFVLGREGGESRRTGSGRTFIFAAPERGGGMVLSLSCRERFEIIMGGERGAEEEKLLGARSQSVLVDLAKSWVTEAGETLRGGGATRALPLLEKDISSLAGEWARWRGGLAFSCVGVLERGERAERGGELGHDVKVCLSGKEDRGNIGVRADGGVTGVSTRFPRFTNAIALLRGTGRTGGDTGLSCVLALGLVEIVSVDVDFENELDIKA